MTKLWPFYDVEWKKLNTSDSSTNCSFPSSTNCSSYKSNHSFCFVNCHPHPQKETLLAMNLCRVSTDKRQLPLHVTENSYSGASIIRTHISQNSQQSELTYTNKKYEINLTILPPYGSN
jgi:hypothetical protein